MQYHLNGFKPGNLEIPDASRVPNPIPPFKALPHKVDVLIVGCGPAGLTLARQLAEFPDITTCIVEKKDGPMLFGQADGISCRTMEIMEAFNCREILEKETYQLHLNAFWEPDGQNQNHIKRTHKTKDARLGLSEFVHGVVNQSRLHDLLLEGMQNSVSQITPHYSRSLVELDVDESLRQDINAYPIKAKFERINGSSTSLEEVQARFIIGCDGGRSSVRKLLNIAMQGDSANKAWGVMDALLVTDFPDIRVKSFIQSHENGAVMVVPREGGYLVRLYVELSLLQENERAHSLNLTKQDIIRQAQAIMAPYSLEIKEVAWWSIYEVGQRVAEHFDDSTLQGAEKTLPRAFLAGDACHTHSPKGGWGLNTSLPDTFNLGWKLAAVLQGKAKTPLLDTYSLERRKVAQMLINADREMSALVATKPNAKAAQSKVGTAEIEKFIARQNGFIAGTSIEYDPSFICCGHANQSLASGYPIGQRFPSVKAVRVADGRPTHLGHLVKADGRWRVFIFADVKPLNSSESEFAKLVSFLETSAQSPLNKYTPEGDDIDSVIDVYSVLQQQYVSLEQMPDLLWPAKGKYQLRDYEKVFCNTSDCDVFTSQGINTEQGCMIIVRPDQHIASILPLNQHTELADFFANIMI